MGVATWPEWDTTAGAAAELAFALTLGALPGVWGVEFRAGFLPARMVTSLDRAGGALAWERPRAQYWIEWGWAWILALSLTVICLYDSSPLTARGQRVAPFMGIVIAGYLVWYTVRFPKAERVRFSREGGVELVEAALAFTRVSHCPAPQSLFWDQNRRRLTIRGQTQVLWRVAGREIHRARPRVHVAAPPTRQAAQRELADLARAALGLPHGKAADTAGFPHPYAPPRQPRPWTPK
jgi:hypothetical protein